MTFTIRSTGGLRRLAAGGLLIAGLVASDGTLAAAQPPAAPSEQEALDAARQALMGATVESVKLDTADGAPKWEVDVKTRDGASYEIQVDPRTGTVLAIERDSN